MPYYHTFPVKVVQWELKYYISADVDIESSRAVKEGLLLAIKKCRHKYDVDLPAELSNYLLGFNFKTKKRKIEFSYLTLILLMNNFF